MFREVKKYVNQGKETSTLNTSIQRFEKYIRKVYGKKKVEILIEGFMPDSKVYACFFEFKKAKRKSNKERVGVDG